MLHDAINRFLGWHKYNFLQGSITRGGNVATAAAIRIEYKIIGKLERVMSRKGIKGKKVCSLNDKYGEIIVADNGVVRSLYFDNGTLQSSIRLDRPGMIIEDYSRAMMSALLFMNNPESILVVGLGGCSLVNFLLKAFTDCAIDIVEIRKAVIDLANKFFLLPGEHPHLKIFRAAAQDFVFELEDQICYDLILIDAFDAKGPSAPLMKKEFIAECRSRLNQNGVFVLNAWTGPDYNFPALYSSVQEIFEGCSLKLPLGEAYQNAIIFGFRNALVCLNMLEYRQMAERMQHEYRINFPKFLRYLYWHNPREQ